MTWRHVSLALILGLAVMTTGCASWRSRKCCSAPAPCCPPPAAAPCCPPGAPTAIAPGAPVQSYSVPVPINGH